MRGGRPCQRSRVDFLERVHEVVTMQSDVGLAESCQLASIEGGIPLLVLLPETNDG